MPVTPARAARLAADGRTDAALVAAFLDAADQAAFAEIVRRHGPMVLGVCRRAIGQAADADDAFQATFLVLVRRARSTAWRASVGPWLYGVATRVAAKARTARARRRAAEARRPAMTPTPADPDDALDAALAALPAAYREPLVLCELEGRSRAEAAALLGLPEGTLSSRLARGRRRLRELLTRGGATAVVPPGLAAAAVTAAAAVRDGAAGAVPVAVRLLTDGVVKGMLTAKLKLAAVAAVGLGLAGFGAWAGKPVSAGDGPPGVVPAGAKPVPPPKPTDAVATIFGDEPLTREQFANYLIRRHGEDELDGFVNKQILVRAFGRKGWTIRAADVTATFEADLKAMNQTREQFEASLRRSGHPAKTLQRWVEDVIEPRLMLAQLAGDAVRTATDAELRRAFDRKHGAKVVCDGAVWAVGRDTEGRAAAALRGSPSFRETARTYGAGQLGEFVFPRTGVEPGGDPLAEAAAALKPGETTPALAYPSLPGGDRPHIVLRYAREIPADLTRSFAEEKPVLFDEVVREKMSRELPKLFNELKKQANPAYHLTLKELMVVPNPTK